MAADNGYSLNALRLIAGDILFGNGINAGHQLYIHRAVRVRCDIFIDSVATKNISKNAALCTVLTNT